MNNLTEDLKIYYPIYKTVADAYGIKWYLLWLVHEQESNASANQKAFDDSTGYIGGMQRDPGWSEKFVDEAFFGKGLGYLETLPQRHAGDAREIAFAARHLTEVTDGTTLGSLYKYGGNARGRYNMYLRLQQVYG